MSVRLARDSFERLVERALAELPEDFRDRVVNVEIAVRARPGREAGRLRGSRSLLGLYLGPPRSALAALDALPALPARILLYQRNIEAACASAAEVKRQVRLTLRHELAHHFGFTDRELRAIWPEGA